MLRRDVPRPGTQASPPIHPPPPPRKRRRIGLLIGLVLVMHVTLPLRYYLGDEPAAERFAWRMFSSVHMARWQSRVVETVRTPQGLQRQILPLETMLEESTVLALCAGQLDYARRLLAYRLERPEVVRVEYEALGRLPGGDALPPVRLVLGRPGAP